MIKNEILAASAFLIALSTFTPSLAQEEVSLAELNCKPTSPGWCRYTNGRFGVSIEIPTKGFNYTVPANGSGLSLKNADQTVSISIYSHFVWRPDMSEIDRSKNVGQKIERLYNSYLYDSAKEQETVSYKVLKDRFYVVSGITAANTFYERLTIAPKCPHIFVAVRVFHASSLKEQLDTIVTKLSRTLRSSCEGLE